MLLYREHRPPKILQCDNGGEFKGDTRNICKSIGIKIVNSRAYHPQSQGKVERSHRYLRDKIQVDLQKNGENWVKNLPEYQSIINDDSKRELAGKSPFEVYFSRKSNYVLKPNADSDDDSEGDDVLLRQKVWPQICKGTVADFELRRDFLTAATYDSSSKCAKGMVNRALKRHPLPVYKLNEKILLRFPFRFGKKAPKRRYAVVGKIVGRNIPLSKYRVEYRDPDSKNLETDWISVVHVTSRTTLKEQKRKKFSTIEELNDYTKREKYVSDILHNLRGEN